MNVEIGAEAALFPEKEYIKGIFVAVWGDPTTQLCKKHFNFNNFNLKNNVLFLKTC
jgi:hypothetical protein